MNLIEEQVLALAPDDASKKAGKDLASPARWVTRGRNKDAAWGECQGSGSKPYQTAIDLHNIAFKCSCPSRKFPCKHGIALGLLLARDAAAFTEGEVPAWVSEWMGKRAAREEKKTETADKPADEAAKAKRIQAREQKVNDGIEELLRWIQDIIRQGIIYAPEKNHSFWDGMARLLVDAQATGLASMVRTLGNTAFTQEGWQSAFLDNLLQLYIVAKAYQQKDTLPELLQQELRTWTGFTLSQDELKAQNGLTDHWLVAGKQVSEDDRLVVEKFWLYGMQSKQFALVLQFIVNGQGANLLLTPGMQIEAELVYFPSVNPLRALIKRQVYGQHPFALSARPGWLSVAEEETNSCARFPVRMERPFIVDALTAVQHNNAWFLKDAEGYMVALPENYSGIWKLLALNGGRPQAMVVIGKENKYEPLGIVADGLYKAL
ncbi:MAG: SWIM zinc finger family protein [Flavihumibacter sp.]